MTFAIAMRRVALAPSTRTVAARRFESSAASKAQSTAKDTANKAAQGLTRVASAAGPAITNAAKGASDALGKVGGRTGKLIKFVERMLHFPILSRRAIQIVREGRLWEGNSATRWVCRMKEEEPNERQDIIFANFNPVLSGI